MVREQLTREIIQVARRQLVEHGPAGLSVRAVARELGMVSSAVYRYFPSRDELLTRLVIEAHDAMGSAVEAAESAVPRRNLPGRWLAVARASRAWALTRPQEYALIFGSPVAGYRTAVGAVDPVTRIPLVLMRISADAAEGRGPVADDRTLPRAVRADLKALRDRAAPALTERHVATALMAWTELIGSISFELFGQLRTVVSDYPAYFDYQMQGVGRRLGLTDRAPVRRPVRG